MVPIFATSTDWTPVGPTSSAQFFIDKASLTRKAGMVQVWELVNMEQADGEGVRSSRFLVEYDCKGQRSRVWISNFWRSGSN